MSAIPSEVEELVLAIIRRAESLCRAAEPHCAVAPCVRHTAEATRQLGPS